MSLEEYNQLSYDYTHCAGAHCENNHQCLRHRTYALLEISTKEHYIV